MRLIDADELLKELAGYRYDTGAPEARRAAHDTQALFREIIKRQPTAYDVDKVIEQLNNVKKIMMPVLDYEEAMKIVKSGGTGTAE